MPAYKNLGGNSSIQSYEIGEDYITISFKRGTRTVYTYSNQTAGDVVVEHMKQLAAAGRGLGSYINRHKPGYIR